MLYQSKTLLEFGYNSLFYTHIDNGLWDIATVTMQYWNTELQYGMYLASLNFSLDILHDFYLRKFSLGGFYPIKTIFCSGKIVYYIRTIFSRIEVFAECRGTYKR